MSNSSSSNPDLVVLGDFCVAGSAMESALEHGKISPWTELRKIFGAGAALVANLECPFTTRQDGRPFKWANLKASPSFHEVLDGLSVAVLANNHVSDFGNGGALETQALLRQKGIASVGYGGTLDEALQPAIITVGSHKIGIVALCCATTNGENLATHMAEGVAPLGIKILQDAVAATCPLCDALLVYLHWGCEWVHEPVPDQLRLARLAIDAGADAVVGCHSHTIQAYECYKGRWIFYGLGNFLFGKGESQEILPDGRTIMRPLRLDAPNRESLAVAFSVCHDQGSGRLQLRQAQPMRFKDDCVPQPMTKSELTFDLDACNAQVQRYAQKHAAALARTEELPLHAQLRNGILAYWYQSEPIGHERPKGWPELLRHAVKKIRRKLAASTPQS